MGNTGAVGLADLANDIGLDEIDREVVAWIEQGVYDEAVRERAVKLEHNPVEAYFQDFHRSFHSDQPVDYRHCSRCDGILRKYT